MKLVVKKIHEKTFSSCNLNHDLTCAEVKLPHMHISKTLTLVIVATCLTVVACTPRIYSFAVEPRTMGQHDTVYVRWAARGKVFLKVQDYNYPGTGSAALPDVTLVFTRDGVTTPIVLRPNSGIQLALPARDSLTIQKQPDANAADILRYIALVATLRGKETDSVVQVEVRVDSATDQIAFTPSLVGDSLVASGINDTVRWGGVFSLLTVAAGSARSLTVSHGGVTEVLTPGQQPDTAFRGSPIAGAWSINSALTQDEKDDHSVIPRFLRITITIKHR
jgi:hypothetical protein